MPSDEREVLTSYALAERDDSFHHFKLVCFGRSEAEDNSDQTREVVPREPVSRFVTQVQNIGEEKPVFLLVFPVEQLRRCGSAKRLPVRFLPLGMPGEYAVRKRSPADRGARSQAS